MNSVCPLMKTIFTFYIMEYISDTTFTRNKDSFFIK